jgi:hypothetical protein
MFHGVLTSINSSMLRVCQRTPLQGPWNLQGSSDIHFRKSEALKLLWKPRTKRAFSAGRRNPQGQPPVVAQPIRAGTGACPYAIRCRTENEAKHWEKGGEMLKWVPVLQA